MSDYGRIGDYIGPVAAKKLSAVDIDANSSNQHEFGATTRSEDCSAPARIVEPHKGTAYPPRSCT